MTSPFDQIPDIIRAVAKEKLMPRYGRLRPEDIKEGETIEQVVTIADTKTEQELQKRIGVLFPGLDFVGEESFKEQGEKPIENGFICDPLDGTYYFKNGKPTFGIMLAYLENGEITRAWLYAPRKKEIVTVEKGKGVFYNGTKMQSPAEAQPLQDQIIVGHIGRKFTSDDMRPIRKNIRKHKLKTGRHICAAMDFMRLAKGELDIVVHKNAYPWDMAVGALIAQELGGHAALLHDALDLNKHLFADRDQQTLFTRYKDDWKPVQKILLAA